MWMIYILNGYLSAVSVFKCLRWALQIPVTSIPSLVCKFDVGYKYQPIIIVNRSNVYIARNESQTCMNTNHTKSDVQAHVYLIFIRTHIFCRIFDWALNGVVHYHFLHYLVAMVKNIEYQTSNFHFQILINSYVL